MKQYLEKIVASIGDGQAPIDYEVDADYDVDVKGCGSPIRCGSAPSSSASVCTTTA